MKKYKRFIIIVMDSLGIGNAKDAHLFSQEGKNDTGANTFDHIAQKYPDMNIPTLKKLGVNVTCESKKDTNNLYLLY